jgi:Tfp pilus assembly protein PilN
MREIDFLPSRYREQHIQRRKQFWRVVVVAMFFALLMLAAAGQYQRRRSVERLLEFTRQRHAAAQATAGQLGQLNAQLNDVRTQAELIVYLRHPWPRTQLVSALLRPLPRSVRLDKLSIRREESPAQAPPPSAAPIPGDPAAVDQRTPAERELAALRDRLDDAATIVLIEGVTVDPAELHAYIGTLSEAELFAHAELTALERADGDSASQARFTARLIVRPGYGQPGGPRPASSPASAGELAVTPLDTAGEVRP